MSGPSLSQTAYAMPLTVSLLLSRNRPIIELMLFQAGRVPAPQICIIITCEAHDSTAW